MTHPFWVSKLKPELAINQNKKQEGHLHPMQKLVRKNTSITRKISLAYFGGQLGGKKNGLQIDRVSYPNSLMELCLVWKIENYQVTHISNKRWLMVHFKSPCSSKISTNSFRKKILSNKIIVKMHIDQLNNFRIIW